MDSNPFPDAVPCLDNLTHRPSRNANICILCLGQVCTRLYLAQFRAGYDRFIEDPWWAKQITELNRISPVFRELWARHEVLHVSEGQKVMYHPHVGELAFDFLLFQTVDSSDLRLQIHTPRSHSGTADKIERLLAFE